MGTFKIRKTQTETYTKSYDIEADSVEEAKNIVEGMDEDLSQEKDAFENTDVEIEDENEEADGTEGQDRDNYND